MALYIASFMASSQLLNLPRTLSTYAVAVEVIYVWASEYHIDQSETL